MMYCCRSESLPAAEANSLKQKVSIMEKEMSSNMLKLNSSENTCTTLKKKVEKLEAEIKRLESQVLSPFFLVKRSYYPLPKAEGYRNGVVRPSVCQSVVPLVVCLSVTLLFMAISQKLYMIST